MAQAATPSISPFLIVSDVPRTLAFYGALGFKTTYFDPANPFFGIAVRDGAQVFFKSDASIAPMPNPKRHPDMRWDAFVSAPDPDALAGELAASGATFSKPLQDTHDGLRGFEITDPDGYVMFFGRPR